MLCRRFAFFCVDSVAEFSVKRVYVAVKPRFGNTVLNVFVHAVRARAVFFRNKSVTDVFKRKYLDAVEFGFDKIDKIAIALAGRLYAQRKQIAGDFAFEVHMQIILPDRARKTAYTVRKAEKRRDKADAYIEKIRKENVSILSLAECSIPVEELFKVFPK